MKKNSYDLIIIGGGPAGMSAGIYAGRHKLNALLISKDFGGQVARKAVMIENYPGFEEVSGTDLFLRMEKHLKAQEIDVERDKVAKIKKTGNGFSVTTERKNQFEAKSVIIASGADPRPLEAVGEKQYIGKGVSYCAACDGPMFPGKTVAVIGGGNAGFETAIFLLAYAKKIYILEAGKEPAAFPILQERIAKSGKVQIIANALVKKIQGRGFVDSLVYEDRLSKKLQALNVEGVFIEIGSTPATSFVKDLVDFNEKDEIKINPKTCETKTKGLFAAGDVTDVFLKQIVVAAGEGAKAEASCYNFIKNINQKN